MKILINASNLKAGGGLQVADSICRELKFFRQHKFTVVLSSFLKNTGKAIEIYDNLDVHYYDVLNNVATIVFGRDKFLDSLVNNNNIDAVLTIFGPSRWEPRCLHLCGYAMSFSVNLESPYYQRMGIMKKLKSKIRNRIYNYFFLRTNNNFYTENPFITERLKTLFKGANIYTVTNFYNQVYDLPDQWIKIELPTFDGTTLLTISNSYPHKNLEIAADVAKILLMKYPGFKFRFIMSIKREQLKADLSGIENHFVFLGTVNIAECPSLYQQCDIAFQPSLMECFTATYPEAMRMERPIVTTDLEFAKGLCGDAAEYYSAIDAQSAADAIYRVATDKKLQMRMVEKGKERLLQYDTYSQRAEKLVGILEHILMADK